MNMRRMVGVRSLPSNSEHSDKTATTMTTSFCIRDAIHKKAERGRLHKIQLQLNKYPRERIFKSKWNQFLFSFTPTATQASSLSLADDATTMQRLSSCIEWRSGEEVDSGEINENRVE